MDAASPIRSTNLLQTASEADSADENRRIDLSIAIVNYESWPDTACLVHALLRSAGAVADHATLAPRRTPVPLSMEILVVDNGSRPHPLIRTLDPLPGVRVLFEPKNRGFAAGVNQGWRSARGRHLLVMNPDLIIPEHFLSKVARRIRWLDDQPNTIESKIGVVGFGLLNPDGSPQYSTGYFPKVWWTLAGQFFPRWRRKYRSLAVRRPHPADWVSGACFLARREVFDAIGGMDERFFLYYEEVDFCLRARRAGWRAVHDPTLRLIHLHPLERRPSSPLFREITRASQLHYVRKNLPAWHYWLLAGAVWCEFVALEALDRVWRAIGRRGRPHSVPPRPKGLMQGAEHRVRDQATGAGK
jgi:GT2 family glycosyltransferase